MGKTLVREIEDQEFEREENRAHKSFMKHCKKITKSTQKRNKKILREREDMLREEIYSQYAGSRIKHI